MAYNETPTRTWDRSTPRDGLLLAAEFARIYDIFASYVVANGGAAPPLTMKQIADTGVFDTGNKTIAGTKTFSSKITGDISGHADGDVALTGDQTVAGVKTFSSEIAGSVTGHAHAITETGTGAGVMRWKIIAIGDWNMDANESTYVTHGITFSKIRSTTVCIIDDNTSVMNDLTAGYLSGGNVSGYYHYSENTGTLSLLRIAGGAFDNVGYNATSFNRGYITIGYID